MRKSARSFITLLLAGGLAGSCWALTNLGMYGLTVFVLMPFILGAFASWTLRPKTAREAILLGVVATIVAFILSLAVRLEGLICIAMVLPLAAPFGALGSWLLYELELSVAGRRRVATFLLLPPFSLFWDMTARPPLFQVDTSIEITAPAELVWQHVVSFSEMPEPRDWLFRAGVAYPKRARIEGVGAGAIRYCEFSTGPFVEPIEVWNEPLLLRFRVTDNPAPMNELNPFGPVMPKHLHGYFVSERGQFRLTRLPGERMRLEGTTWYRHGLWPAGYWR